MNYKNDPANVEAQKLLLKIADLRTIRQIAEELFISPNTITRWRRGECRPTRRSLSQLRQYVLNVATIGKSTRERERSGG